MDSGVSRSAGATRANSAISRRVTEGASSASPDATRRMPLDELVGGNVLEQEAAGAGAKRVVDVLVELEGGEH